MKSMPLSYEDDEEYVSSDWTDDGDDEIEKDEIDELFDDLGIDVDEGLDGE